MALDADDEVIGYKFVHLGKMMDMIRNGVRRAKKRSKRISTPTAVTTTRSSTSTRERNKEAELTMAKFEGYERRIKQIEACLNEYGISSLDDCKATLLNRRASTLTQSSRACSPSRLTMPAWAYTLGVAIALKKGVTNAAEAAEAIGIGLQAFCIPGSVAESRKVGLGHGNLAAMLLREETKCFCFLAGHESFAAAEGAIGIARTANKVRKEPLRVILNGLGKDAAYIISRINGFTYVQTDYDFYKNELVIVKEKAYSEGDKAKAQLLWRQRRP